MTKGGNPLSMNNDTAQLVPFNYEDAQVRVVMINTEPWFVLADLCKVLGLARGAAQVAERLDDGVRQAYPITDSLGRTQQAIIVSESGMYEVVIRTVSRADVSLVTGLTWAELGFPAKAHTAALFPRRAVLRVGMLLRDSAVARRVRDMLLDFDHDELVSYAKSRPAEGDAA